MYISILIGGTIGIMILMFCIYSLISADEKELKNKLMTEENYYKKVYKKNNENK